VVTEEGGRTVVVQPATQMVLPMLDWVTAGLTAPGVRREFGRTAPAALTVSPAAAGTTRAAVGGGAGCGGLVVEGLVAGLVDGAADWLLDGLEADAEGLSKLVGAVELGCEGAATVPTVTAIREATRAAPAAVRLGR
jgi:hypothetical protein